MYLRAYLIKVLFLSSLSYHHIILFCRPGLSRQYEISKLLLWLNACLGIISYYQATLMLTRKISETTSLTYYYYLFYCKFWCINWWYDDRQRHDIQLRELVNLPNFLPFSIPLLDIEFLMPLLGFCISFDLLTLFLFCELVFLLFYFYFYRPISLFNFYVITLFFFWTVFLLNPSPLLDCTASWVFIDYYSMGYHQLLSTHFNQL